MTKRSLSLGFVGAGFLSQAAHLPSFAALDGVRITALAELRPELARRVAARWDIPNVYSSHTEMLAEADVDAVVAITPRSATGHVARDVLSAGKPLFTEKPIAGSHAEASELVSLAKSQGVPYAVGTMRRFDGGYQYAHDFIKECKRTGSLGALTYARVHCFQGDDYCNEFGAIRTDEPPVMLKSVDGPEWLDPELAGKFDRFHNVFCHDIDLLRYLVGEPRAVDFVRVNPRAGRIVVFDHGSHGAVLEAGELDTRTWEETVTVFFEGGRVQISSPAMLLRNTPARVELMLGGEPAETRVPHIEFGWAFHRQARAFVDALTQGTPLCNSADESLADLYWIEEIWRKDGERCPSTA